jgi:uncharacterized repeat protein (TIGR03803 family)
MCRENKRVSSIVSQAVGRTAGGPLAPVAFDKSGNLYGTTYVGGSDNEGVIFERTYANGQWNEGVVYNFTDNDGANPQAGVVIDQRNCGHRLGYAGR